MQSAGPNATAQVQIEAQGPEASSSLKDCVPEIPGHAVIYAHTLATTVQKTSKDSIQTNIELVAVHMLRPWHTLAHPGQTQNLLHVSLARLLNS